MTLIEAAVAVLFILAAWGAAILLIRPAIRIVKEVVGELGSAVSEEFPSKRKEKEPPPHG